MTFVQVNGENTPVLKYLNSIDGVRAIAVLAVVAFHANARALPSGFLGVDVFFLISGFVVTYSIMTRSFDSRSAFLLFFYRRRAVRIFPALAFWAVMTAIVTVLFIPRTTMSIDSLKTGVFALAGGSNIFLALSSNGYFAPTAELNPFTQTWSLGVEEQFYVLFSVVVVVAALHRRAMMQSPGLKIAVVLVSIASLVLATRFSATQPDHAFYMIDTRLWQLGLGMGLALTIGWWRPALSKLRSSVLDAVTAGVLAALLATFLPPPFAAVPSPQALPASLLTALLIALLATSECGWVGKTLTSPVPRSIGRASYSIYLAHWPIMVVCRWTIGLDHAWVQVACVVLSLLLGFASYHLIEQPVRNAPRLRAMKPVRVLAGSLVSLGLAALVMGASFASGNRITLSRTGDRTVWSGFQDSDIIAGTCGLSTRPLAGFAASSESVQVDVRACNGMPVSSHRLFVAGDSHAGAYRRMLTGFAREMRMPVSLYSRGGCTILNLKQINADRGPACAAFAGQALSDILRTVRPGDFVLLPSMRVSRFITMWGGAAAAQPAPDRAMELRAMAEAESFLRQVSARGATAIIEAPLPVAKSPAFRCLDWFNRNNPVCASGFVTSRAEQEAVRETAMQKIARLDRLPNVIVWDPLSVLCGKDRCDLVPGGIPMIVDSDHVSGRADDRLAPAFIRFVREVSSS